jgi:excisionase family DNA binding protein
MNIYSTNEAAQKLGLSPDHVRRLVRDGEIKGKKLGHDWVVLDLSYKRKRKPRRKKGESNEES